MVASFATFGLFWGSWAVMLFDIQHTFGLNDAQLGVLLAVAIAVAGASSAVMAHFCDRVGARRLLWIALLAWSRRAEITCDRAGMLCARDSVTAERAITKLALGSRNQHCRADRQR